MRELAYRFLDLAEREAEHERRYYQRAAGLGSDFLDALNAALSRARRMPDAGSSLGGEDDIVRAATLVRFPFRLIYVVQDGELVVVAIAHNRRRPGYWKRRLRGERRPRP